MSLFSQFDLAAAFLPFILMFLASLIPAFFAKKLAPERLWKYFNCFAIAALGFTLLSLLVHLAMVYTAAPTAPSSRWLATNLFGCWVSLLVQFLGTVIGVFSSRHLRGEPRQPLYIASLAGVLTSVHLLLLANHWVVLIFAWAAIGHAMQNLLCYYPERPYALLAAHKKRVADLFADILLVAAAALAWWQVESGTLSLLWSYIDQHGSTPALDASAICLALAVILRTALLPVHGWLIQVMEAPTPVSALLHAGVVNLAGFVLVLFAPLLGVTPIARWLLVGFGLVSAVLGGIIMLTRVSIKVHLAWSTVAQMGFMLLECGLGLYALAALHLIGHSLYKAHSFLSTSSEVRRTRLNLLTGHSRNNAVSMLLAPPIALAIIVAAQWLVDDFFWPWWWTGVLMLAWAPLLWTPLKGGDAKFAWLRMLTGLGMVAGLTLCALLADLLPLGAEMHPFNAAGVVALVGMALMYLCFVMLQLAPSRVAGLRHWIYNGFYLDETYTILALKLWPTKWANTATYKPRFVVAANVDITPSKVQ